MSETLKAPFPWFGGKRRVAPIVWQRFGKVRNYVEPFAGSLAVLLGRPTPFDGPETVNDADGFIANVFRAIALDPEAVADWADYIVSECDVHARHVWLVAQRDSLVSSLEGDPNYFDAKVAGWWLYGIAAWIGSGWCSGKGPWRSVEMEDGSRQLVHLGDEGRGVNRQRVHLGDEGRGVNRQRDGHRESLFAYMRALSTRLRYVRVCCGDWSRVMGETPMLVRSGNFSPVGVFLDPPYSDEADRAANLYRVDCLRIAHDVREWAIAHGDDPRYRICFCGYEGEHDMPLNWAVVTGKAGGGSGYGGQSKDGYKNAGRERLWFSPYCIDPMRERMPLFAFAGFDDGKVEEETES